MKKLFGIGIICSICLGAAYGAQTCIHTGTVVYILKKSVNGLTSSYNTPDKTWSVTFDYDIVANNPTYRTLTGNATCNEITTDSDGGAVHPGSNNVYLRAGADDFGKMCWCAMTGPVTSWWTFLHEYGDADACANTCAAACADAVQNNTDSFRSNGIYLAIW